MSTSRRKAIPTTATMRLKNDLKRLRNDPVPYIEAAPLPSNLLEWHYVVTGPEKSHYEGGYFHGKLVFSTQYPFQPPSIYIITPNGRFHCNTRLCLSISDFHPDTWNPAWSVSTILTGLLSFMLEDTPTVGSVVTTSITKKQLSQDSLSFNLRDSTFCELFPELTQKIQMELRERQEKKDAASRSRGLVTSGSGGGPMAAVHGTVGQWGGGPAALSNLVIVAGLAMFVFAVKHVVRSLLDE